MGREVITDRDIEQAQLRKASGGQLAAGTSSEPEADKYSDRLVKYIPSEVIVVYLAADGVLRFAEKQIPQGTLWWIVFGFMLVMTPLYLWRVQKVSKVQQLVISTVSFAAWVFTIGGPFTQFSWYSPFYGALLLPLYTFGVAVWSS